MTLGGSIRDIGNRMDGGFLVGGITSGTTTFTGTDGRTETRTAGGLGADAFVLTATEDGAIERLDYFDQEPGTSGVNVFALTEHQGGSVALGSGSGTADGVPMSPGPDGGWLTRIAPDGAVAWSKGASAGVAVEAAQDGSLVLAASPGMYDQPLLTVLEADGAERWSRSVSQVGAYYPPAIAAAVVGPEGTIWLTGSFYDAFLWGDTVVGDGLVDLSVGNVLFVAEVDSVTGDLLSFATAKPIAEGGVYAALAPTDLAVTADGGVLVSGVVGAPAQYGSARIAFGGVTLGRLGGTDGFAARLGSEGWEWAVPFGLEDTSVSDLYGSTTYVTDGSVFGVDTLDSEYVAILGQYATYDVDNGQLARHPDGSGPFVALLDPSTGASRAQAFLGPPKLVETGRFAVDGRTLLVGGVGESDPFTVGNLLVASGTTAVIGIPAP